MDIKEAMGYVQAVADNCNDAPRYQRALQTVLDYVEASYDEQNRLLGEIASLQEALDAKHRDIENLKHGHAELRDNFDLAFSTLEAERKEKEALRQELVDERYRHDRYVDYSMGQDKMIDALRVELASMRARCQKLLEENKRLDDRIECLLTM